MSALILDAYLEAGDARLLVEVLASTDARALGPLASKWIADERPVVRRMLLEYIDDGCTRPNHQPLIKRLFKQAENQGVGDVLAHFAVVFDRLARRELVNRFRWDPDTGGNTEEVFIADATIPRTAPTARTAPVGGRAPNPTPQKYRDPWSGKMSEIPRHHLPTFSFRTRRYLQRRAWRRYRTLGKTNASRYVEEIGAALELYADEHLSTPFLLLDSWTLVHALYHHSPVLEQTTDGWTVRVGQDLADLEAAPAFGDAWSRDPGPLFALVERAQSRTVRLFGIDMLRRGHSSALEGIEFAGLRSLLTSPHEEVQIFAAELLRHARGLEVLPVAEWLSLLGISNPVAIPLIVEMVKKHVSPTRLSDDECAALAVSHVAPVAELGFEWLSARPVSTAAEIERALELTKCKAESVRVRATPWLVEQIDSAPAATPEHARELLDARYEDVREAGTAYIFGHDTLGIEPKLWGAMSETPYPDVRAALVAQLDRASSPLEADQIQRVWASVLTAIQRGSRAKAKATRQLAGTITANPDRADALLPLLAIALRSLSPVERKTAIASLAKAAFEKPALAASIGQHFPELKLWPEVGA